MDENNEKNQFHFEQFNQTNFDEHLFEYLDWETLFNEQDLPDELCEELFQHWSSIVCDDQPCNCNSESKITLINNTEENDSSYDDRCLCSECSCTCEKYEDEKSICLCSQCSCKCFKDFSNENEDTIDDIPEIDQKISEKEIYIDEEVQTIPLEQLPIEENEIIISDCFINRIDRWTEQFNLYQSSSSSIYNSIELDDPTYFRQQILSHYQKQNHF